MFYWSLKSVPELQRRSATERRQAAWQLGLKPLFYWQVWAALFVTGFLMLWGLETLAGNLFLSHAGSITRPLLAAMVAAAVLIVFLSQLVYTHVYLKAMRPYIRRVSFDHSEGWLSALFKSAIMKLLTACLMVASMLVIDWAINSYDESPAAPLVALKDWPKRIPAAGNGFLTAAGLLAEPGASASEAGEHWVAAVNAEAARHAGQYPAPPRGLQYAAYAGGAAPGARAGSPGDARGFCDVGREACWKIWGEHKADVLAWLQANHELLSRYQALQKSPQWQFDIVTDDEHTPVPSYDAMLNAQDLYLAAAIQEMSKGLAGKKPAAKWQVELFGRGLEMIGEDIAFARTMLAGKDRLAGKMVAASMLAKDMALVAETAASYPRDVRPHWDKIEKMFEPFSEDQVSLADGFKFEEKLASSQGQERYARIVGAAPRFMRPWLEHHYRKDDTARIMAAYWENVVRETAVSDSSRTPPLAAKAAPALPRVSRWTGYLHNQGGELVLLEYSPRYQAYVNRMYDLNAMNALLRVRAEIGLRHITPNGVAAFLGGTDKALWNPETGKPFEWDAEQKEIYFTPASDFAKERYRLGSSAPGRVGLGM